jgi:hypothetical protein
MEILLSLGLNYGVHYASTRLYDVLCIPHSFTDILKSLATTGSPMCSFVLNTMTVTQNNYAVVLTASVTSIVTRLLTLRREAN